ncbi:hypothetical protein J4530_10080 [Neisseria subflava]|uniref:hypothetical protein n=1 Tax=Neisseria subflava TaxID=28449 RepID=UPI00202A50AE|nr:hypothetical protein [Neisseria subflava]MCL9788474.1 hypothetical protein [Neisseria subflava]
MTMQKPFSAHRLLTLAALLAALPASAAPNNITDLGTLKSDNSGGSSASAISADGSVVIGHPDSIIDGRSIIWSGSGWQTKTELGTLRADNSGGVCECRQQRRLDSGRIGGRRQWRKQRRRLVGQRLEHQNRPQLVAQQQNYTEFGSECHQRRQLGGGRRGV